MSTVTPEEARELRETLRAGLERIHERLDAMDAKLSELPRLDERTKAIRSDVDRHERCLAATKRDIADTKEKTAWAARIGIGGGAAGGAGIIAAIIDWITK